MCVLYNNNFFSQVASQCARPPNKQCLSTVIAEPPCNSIVPIPTTKSSTIVITDCTPSVCKNMADTLNLMIVCNLLQNSQDGREVALKLARPVISELMTSPTLSCGCQNPFANVCPNALSNLIPGQLANALTQNFAAILPNGGCYNPISNAGAVYSNSGAIISNSGSIVSNSGAIVPNAVSYGPPCSNVVNPNAVPPCSCCNCLLDSFLNYI